MKTAAACLSTLLFATGASACPVSTAVMERYGISAAGFLSLPPVAQANADPSFLKITLTDSLLVSDGFRHTLFVDRQAKAAWIRRTGGLLGGARMVRADRRQRLVPRRLPGRGERAAGAERSGRHETRRPCPPNPHGAADALGVSTLNRNVPRLTK